MRPLSLNIGPSEISAAVIADIRAITADGLLTESHRGPRVQGVLKEAVGALRDAMGIPEEYAIVFQPSATACMELILRNTVEKRSFHFVQGAFAQRFATTATQVGLDAARDERAWDAPPAPQEFEIPPDVELLAITHNETSTGRMWPAAALRAVRAAHPGPLLAVDVTSSFGALAMPWTEADLWFFSVQKCLGLPAGLGVTLAGPRAVARAQALGDGRRVAAWQDLPVLARQITSGQTPETPNVFALALLGRQMRRWDLARVEAETQAKASAVADAAGDAGFFIREPAWRSRTTHCLVVGDPDGVQARARAAGFVLGSGYGPLKDRCVRIATFPAVDLDTLRSALAALDLQG